MVAEPTPNDPVAAVDGDERSPVVRLRGEIDVFNARLLEAALMRIVEADPDQVIVDLSDVRFLDSTGLSVLVRTRRKLRNWKAFVLAAPNPDVRRTLDVSGLLRQFTVVDEAA